MRTGAGSRRKRPSMHLREFPDWHEVVAGNWQKTTGFLLALRDPCLRIRDEELAAIRKNRVLVALDPTGLKGWVPPESWLLAVLVCPGDDVRPVVDWVREHGTEPDRVKFYARRGTDLFDALGAWAEAGLPDPVVEEGFVTWRDLHRAFGRDLAIRILQDWGISPP